MSAIQSHWKKTAVKCTKRGLATADIIRCADGFQASVQTSFWHSCSPRMVLEDGAYSSWEVGFPNQVEPDLLPYIDQKDDDPTRTIYGHVPTAVVDAIIAKHGGLI